MIWKEEERNSRRVKKNLRKIWRDFNYDTKNHTIEYKGMKVKFVIMWESKYPNAYIQYYYSLRNGRNTNLLMYNCAGMDLPGIKFILYIDRIAINYNYLSKRYSTIKNGIIHELGHLNDYKLTRRIQRNPDFFYDHAYSLMSKKGRRAGMIMSRSLTYSPANSNASRIFLKETLKIKEFRDNPINVMGMLQEELDIYIAGQIAKYRYEFKRDGFDEWHAHLYAITQIGLIRYLICYIRIISMMIDWFKKEIEAMKHIMRRNKSRCTMDGFIKAHEVYINNTTEIKYIKKSLRFELLILTKSYFKLKLLRLKYHI